MRYRVMATYRGVPYEVGLGPSNSEVVLFAACPPPEELGFEPATGHWRKQVIRAEIDALWESRPVGTFRGEPCIVLDDPGEQLHIAYLGTDADRAAYLGYWQVDRGVFELLAPREEVAGLTEERVDKPLRWGEQADETGPMATYPYGTAPWPVAASFVPAPQPPLDAVQVEPAPPADAPLADAPLADALPAGAPLADTPPADVPSTDGRPADAPLASAPVDPPLASAPPAGSRSADVPPADAPPAGAPPASAPPPGLASASQAGSSPTDPPPADAPPAGAPMAGARPDDPPLAGTPPADPGLASAPPTDSGLASAALAGARRARLSSASIPPAGSGLASAPPAEFRPASVQSEAASPPAPPAPPTAPAPAEGDAQPPTGAWRTAMSARMDSYPDHSPAGEAPSFPDEADSQPLPVPPGFYDPESAALAETTPANDTGGRAARRQRIPTREIFSELADLASIPRAAYALETETDGAMCLLPTPDGFEVFIAADGARHELRFFTDEEAAYFYLFGVLAAEAIRSGALASTVAAADPYGGTV